MKRHQFFLFFCFLWFQKVCSLAPGVIVSISPHLSGTYTVSISFLDENCTENDLKKIVYRIGNKIGEDPRGLTTYQRCNQGKSYWCARFAIKNIVYGKPSFIKLRDIVLGFCSYWREKGRTGGKVVVYVADMRSHPGLIRYYSSSDLRVTGTFHSQPMGLEYVVEVNNAKNSIFIPEKVNDCKEVKEGIRKKGIVFYDYFLISLISCGLTLFLYYLVRLFGNYFYKKKG